MPSLRSSPRSLRARRARQRLSAARKARPRAPPGLECAGVRGSDDDARERAVVAEPRAPRGHQKQDQHAPAQPADHARSGLTEAICPPTPGFARDPHQARQRDGPLLRGRRTGLLGGGQPPVKRVELRLPGGGRGQCVHVLRCPQQTAVADQFATLGRRQQVLVGAEVPRGIVDVLVAVCVDASARGRPVVQAEAGAPL